ncbi:MAG: NUDIX domain-containing protein [bacterium]|nr:NUDIX domain-containing protein [bacterium]
MNELCVVLNEKSIMTCEDLEKVVDSKLYQHFISIQKDVDLVIIEYYLEVDGQIKFLLLSVKKKGENFSKLVFVRFDSVATLLRITNSETGQKHFLMAKQSRIAVGESSYTEIIAGTLDKAGDSLEQILREITEESSLKIFAEQLKLLGSWHPSCGGCNERIYGYFGDVMLTTAQIAKILAKTHGVAAENESIHLELFSADDLLGAIACGDIQDGKTLAALALFLVKVGFATVKVALEQY